MANRKRRAGTDGAKYQTLKQRLEAAEQGTPAPVPGVPDTVYCPFTGEPLVIREIKTEYPGVFRYMAIGQFWTTRSYQTIRQLKWALCHRDGEAPDFGPSEVEKVTHIEAPAPSAVADQLRKDEQVEKNALDMITRTMESDTDRKIFVQPGGQS